MIKVVKLDGPAVGKCVQQVHQAWRTSAKVVQIECPGLQGEQVREFYDQVCKALGEQCAFAEDATISNRAAQRTGEIWMEVRFDSRIPDAYRHSANAQPLHTDGSYVRTYPNATLMCCVTNAANGGDTIFLDSLDLVAALEAENPALLRQLKNTTMAHARSGDRRDYPVIREEHGAPLLNWNYYCVDPSAPLEIQQLKESFFQFLQTSPSIRARILPVKLKVGDGIVWKDEQVLHGRNAFVAKRTSERFLWKCAVDVRPGPSSPLLA